MQVSAQAVEVDADAFVLPVMRRPADDVRRRRADGSIELDLLTAHTLLKARCQQQVTQSTFDLVDRVSALRWRLGRLLGRNVVRQRQSPAPRRQLLRGQLAIKVLVIETVVEGLQAVDARRLAHRRAVVHDGRRCSHYLLETVANLVEKPCPPGIESHSTASTSSRSTWPITRACRSSIIMSRTRVAAKRSASSTL